METKIDPLTKLPHISPTGLEHLDVRQNGKFFLNSPIYHHLINMHQEAYPELKEQMRNNPDASKVYMAFLMLLPLEIRGRLTPDEREKILKSYNLV